MEEIGVVKEIDGLKAIIAVKKQGSCESCPGGSVCKTLGGGEAVVEALNDIGAHVGDTVRVAFKPYTYLKGTVLIYGIPALMLIVGAVIGKEYLSRVLTNMDPDIASAIGGFGLFALTFLGMKLWSKKSR
ncbi:MAG: SoxR reducing system RseC family protein [Nitrospirae bacterium]|nr:SoxR reducing system RseC family protein [Nitrospirota bacterium]